MEFNLKLKEQELQIVLNALSKEQYLTVVDTINNIQKQASKQIEVTSS